MSPIQNPLLQFSALLLLLLHPTFANSMPSNITNLPTSPIDSKVAAGWPKRGLPFNNPPRYIRNFSLHGSQVNWAYNWGSNMPPDFPGYLEFIPMLHSDKSEHTNPWFNDANNALLRGTGHLMAFNEPDGCAWGQSCMTPQQAATAYRQYMEPFASRASLGAPSVTNGPNGLPWLREFLRLCTGCKIDFVPIHWYDRANNADYFKRHVELALDAAGARELWVPEFHADGTTLEQALFLLNVLPWLDTRPYVFRYGWFWADPNYAHGTLVDQNGYPTFLGNIFAYTPQP